MKFYGNYKGTPVFTDPNCEPNIVYGLKLENNMKKRPSEIFEENNNHCVQCGAELTNHDFTDTGICNNESCANYGILQLGIEAMPFEGDDD